MGRRSFIVRLGKPLALAAVAWMVVVTAEAAAGTGGVTDIPGPAGFPANTLPDHLNASSTLTATITADGGNELSFDLATDPAGR